MLALPSRPIETASKARWAYTFKNRIFFFISFDLSFGLVIAIYK